MTNQGVETINYEDILFFSFLSWIQQKSEIRSHIILHLPAAIINNCMSIDIMSVEVSK